MFQLLSTAVCTAIELSINKVLSLDPSGQTKLSALSGPVIAIQCTSPELEIFISVRNQAIHLSTYYEGEPDTCIIGSANALLRLLTAKDKNHSFYDKELALQGRLEHLQALQKVLLGLNIDWEFHLSKFIGDIPTQTFSDSVATASHFAKNTHDSLMMDIDEYVHEERKLFPSERELESFYGSIDALRLKLDRVQARVVNLLD